MSELEELKEQLKRQEEILKRQEALLKEQKERWEAREEGGCIGMILAPICLIILLFVLWLCA